VNTEAVVLRSNHESAVGQIIRRTARFFTVEPDELLGPDRHHLIVHARHVAMYLARKRTRMSFPEIGRAFGKRDHTTVMSAVTKITGFIRVHPEIRAEVDSIERGLDLPGPVPCRTLEGLETTRESLEALPSPTSAQREAV